MTTVTYTATDADGNTTTCQFTVEVTGTCDTLTELTTNMFINASNFVVNQDRDAIVTVDNIGANPTSGQIQFALTKPATSFFSTTIPAINYTADVLLPGGIATNNGDWSCTNNGIFYLCTSKPGVVINPGNSSIIGMNFKADGPSAVPNSKAQAVSSLGTGTGGDQNIDNNRAKSNLIIN
ncbi:MAG: hypothetical protein UZ09_BCD002002251 [Bacteroidetes bacterium OLB9]|nr:MAG: hypothetical protein UZ09_BCD002002251 [Bacteroidetes bacterium OLB9]